MLPIYVISLKTAIKRRRIIESQFDGLGLNFDFFDTIDDSKLAGKPTEWVDEDQFLLNMGRLPTNADIACFLSHRQLWVKCVEQGRALIILEDDCTLNKAFLRAASLPVTNALDLGIIRLHNESNPRRYPIFAQSGTTFWRYTKAPSGACAYILSPVAAQKLLDASEVISAPVGNFINMSWLFDQPIHAMTPYAIEMGPLSSSSQISNRTKEKHSLNFMLRRPLYKTSNWIKRLAFNRRQINIPVHDVGYNADLPH